MIAKATVRMQNATALRKQEKWRLIRDTWLKLLQIVQGTISGPWNQLSGPPFVASGSALSATNSMTSGYQCAGCGEWNEIVVEASGGRRQSYVEDCQVCCKSNILTITWDASAAEYTVSAELE